MMLAIFFSLEIWRTNQRARKHSARWPVLLAFLLAATGVMVVAEVANAVLWSSLGVYTGGLLWIVTLCGIQFIAIVAYEHQSGFSHTAGDWPNMRMRGRLRSGDGTDHPNGTANVYANINPDTPTPRQLGRDPNRYTDHRATNGRPVTNPAIRPDTNALRR